MVYSKKIWFKRIETVYMDGRCQSVRNTSWCWYRWGVSWIRYSDEWRRESLDGFQLWPPGFSWCLKFPFVTNTFITSSILLCFLFYFLFFFFCSVLTLFFFGAYPIESALERINKDDKLFLQQVTQRLPLLLTTPNPGYTSHWQI